MLLHQNEEEFKTLVSLAADYYGIRDYQVEKDYYVSLFLKKLSEQKYDFQLVFKGGTSLSKCYRAIDRFSEDIDLAVLTLDAQVNASKRRKLKELIVSTSTDLNMEISNFEEIHSRRDFNSYLIKFDNLFDLESDIMSHVIVETIVVYQPFPTIIKEVSNFITNYVLEIKREDIVEKYQLEPFEMLIQSVERTFIDKIFAICDYHLNGTYDRYSRHLYDIYMIWNSSMLDKNLLVEIIPNVISDRQRFEDRNPSCKKGSNPIEILLDILRSEVYRNDYLNITSKLIYNSVSYEECVDTMHEIIASGIIPDVIIDSP